MLSVEEALAEVLRRASPIATETVSLFAALGRVLAGEVTSGVDSPPFDKALMDGFAVRAEDVGGGGATLEVIETVTAGQVAAREVGRGEATRIMTGAALPAGADAVVPIERTTAAARPDAVTIASDVRAGANILYRGESMQAGERVFAAGHMLRPQDLGVLAELGVANVPVRRRPRIAVLATGDELVPPEQTPGAGQIRNSNESLLVGLVMAAGCEPVPLGIARDVKEELRAKIDAGLACDVLILSGGVSAGDLDLVPAVLKEAGVGEVFHGVNVKPGKPVWFGAKGEGPRAKGEGQRAESGGHRAEQSELGALSSMPLALSSPPCAPTLVFGLPGNPVSTLVCFELFARAAIGRLLGIEPPEARAVRGVLSAAYENRGDRPTYHPARIAAEADGRVTVTPVRWAGSGDLRATVEANGTAVFEGGRAYAAGEVVVALLWAGAAL